MAHIQIRNVPEDVHRTLKARAARRGQSLSEYLLGEITELGETLSIEELQERIRARPPVRSTMSAAEAIRLEREEREQQLGRR